jgi:hypothetical protein
MTGVKRFDWRDCIWPVQAVLVRSMHIFVILLCVLNVFARIVIAAVSAERALLQVEAAAACDVGCNDARSVTDQQKPINRLSTVIENSVTASCVLEALVLVLTCGAFLLFSPPASSCSAAWSAGWTSSSRR